MDEQKTQMFLMTNQKNFDAAQLPIITEKLQQIEDDKLILISSANYKEPTTMLIISLFLGGFGVDRFMLGDTGMGVLKLLTAGCLGILTIIDWFTVTKRTKEKNLNIFMEAIENHSLLFTKNSNTNNSNTVENIKRYKELLDKGIITSEEFEKKKTELLNL